MTAASAHHAIASTIDGGYNSTGRHSTFGYRLANADALQRV